MKRIPWFEIILTIFIMGVSVYAALSDAQNLSRNWFARDDAYYYFKVAQNISEGRGSTFDGINPTNGYHPLWMLICVPVFALARFDLILPLRVLLLLLGALNAASAVLIYHLLKRALTPAVAALAAVYWATNYLIQTTLYQQGLESGIAAFCVLLLLYYLSRHEEKWKTDKIRWQDLTALAILATLVMFSRLDLVFLAVLAGFRVVFRKSALSNLLTLDLLFILASVLTGFVLRLGLPEYYLYSTAAEIMTAAAALISIPTFYFFGLYDIDRSPLEMLKRSGAAVIVSSAILAGLMLTAAFALHFDVFPRSTLLYYPAFMFVMTASSRLGAIWFSDSNAGDRPTPLQELKESWRGWLQRGAVFYGILLGALAVYMLINLVLFETPSPVSGQIKRWWGSHASRVYGGAARTKLDFFGISPETEFNAWAPVTWEAYELSGRIPYFNDWHTRWQTKYTLTFTGMLIAAAAVLFVDRKQTARVFQAFSLLPLLAGAGIQIFSYNISGYAGMKEWYWVAQLIAILIVASTLVDAFARHAQKLKGGQALLWLIACAFGIRMAIMQVNYVRGAMPHGAADPGAPLMDAIPFLEANTPPGAVIGMTGGGNVGYFIHDRVIVNMDGLINSYDYFKALQAGRAADYLAEHELEYIFANPGILEGLPYRGQFTGRYAKGERFGGKVLMEFIR